MADGLPRPGCRVILALEVGFALHHPGAVGFVDHEKIGLIPAGPVAMSDMKSGNSNPFRHVLTVVPLHIPIGVVGIKAIGRDRHNLVVFTDELDLYFQGRGIHPDVGQFVGAAEIVTMKAYTMRQAEPQVRILFDHLKCLK